MGVDFLSKAGKSIERKFDRALADLGTPDLFSVVPECTSRTCAATLEDGETVSPGEQLVIRLLPDGIVAQRAIKTVARFNNPHAKLIETLKVSRARAGVVCTVLPFGRTIEIKVD